MWYYNNEPFDPSDEELKKYYGFVYLITNLETNIKYVGKKQIWGNRKLKPLKGKTRKRIKTVESDWRDYYGSSETVKKLLIEHGPKLFHREILHFCHSKGELSYMELLEQINRDVLFRDDYYNGIIQVRINKTHLRGLDESIKDRLT